jgi:polysaccharide deacetylase 2 family uncharacterized protein YibQ
VSHELEDNKERRRHILAKMRQHTTGLPYQKLVAMIMDEFGYNLRGAKEKVKELHFMGYIKERNLYWFDAEILAHSDALKREKERSKVKQGSVQEESTRQEES